LLPWSPDKPPRWAEGSRNWGISPNGQAELDYPPIDPGMISLAPLLAGSEGTLAVIRKLKVRLVPVPKFTILGVLSFASIAQACDIVPAILEHHPTAIELIPQSVIRLARGVPAYAHQLSFVQGDPAALLAVEFSGDNLQLLRERVESLGGNVFVAETAQQQRQVWGIRKVGLGIMQSRPGDTKPLAFIEDLSVPVDNLGEFVREMEAILASHGTFGEIYAHASAGCLHIRPMLNLKSVQGVTMLRAIAHQAVTLTLRLGGSVSGEHGDGIARSEWLERMYGTEILAAFQLLKHAADPNDLLNPGKIVSASTQNKPAPMDSNLRYGPDYLARGWQATLSFSDQAGLEGAIEQCNGAGVCRKAEGVMCPSFQATQEEMHNTRGRANLLRAMISGRFPTAAMAEKTVYEALDLCLACKGCKAECPSAVDMAKLKYEFLSYAYSNKAATRRRRKLRDFLFGYIDSYARIGYPFAWLVNPLLRTPMISRFSEKFFGLAHQRPFPQLAGKSLHRQFSKGNSISRQPSGERVLLLSDAFNEFFFPHVGLAAVRALHAVGCQVQVLPVIGAGRTLISKGFLEPARRHASRLVNAINRLDPAGESWIVGLEPSELYTLRDEYLDLLPADNRVKSIAEHTLMIDEFLIRPGPDGKPRIEKLASLHPGSPNGSFREPQKVLLHGHCYQKAQPPAADGFRTGVSATVAMLSAAGFQVEVIDSGCCGMAGAFGYEREHYDLSIKIAELALLPAVRNAEEKVIIAACGVSCQAQIEDGAGRKTVHPILLM
jgi:Fe-S oxidoreductase